MVVADAGIDAVGGDDDVGVGEIGRIDGDAETEHDALLGAAGLQDAEQRHAGDAGEAVAGAADLGALLMDGNVVPIGEFGADAVERGAVAGEEFSQCLVGEHDAEAERVVGLVLLDDLDVPIGAALLGQQGEI